MKRFFLGTHMPQWLANPRFAGVPLFISRRVLDGIIRAICAFALFGRRIRGLVDAVTEFALDSGGFTELQMNGRWTLDAEEYALLVLLLKWFYGDRLLWVAPQDWMCEPQVIQGLVKQRPAKPCPVCKKRIAADAWAKGVTPSIDDLPKLSTVALAPDESPHFTCFVCGHEETGKRPAINVSRWHQWAESAGPVMHKALRDADRYGIDAVVVFHGTGLSVEEHQRRTVANYLELRAFLGDLVIPVLQGWRVQDYWRHEEMYAAAGVRLADCHTVGVGSVCRRQAMNEATLIMRSLAASGLRLHGFGFKKKGVEASHEWMASADSMAWSFDARRSPPPRRARQTRRWANQGTHQLRQLSGLGLAMEGRTLGAPFRRAAPVPSPAWHAIRRSCRGVI